jgi:hypothetical protein
MPSKEAIQATEEVAKKTRLSVISRTFLRQHDLDQVQGSPCRPALLAPMASQPPAGAPLAIDKIAPRRGCGQQWMAHDRSAAAVRMSALVTLLMKSTTRSNVGTRFPSNAEKPATVSA